MIERKKGYIMYILSLVGEASTGFQKSLCSSASDIDSVYAPRVSDIGGMLICRFAWWGWLYGTVENGKKCDRARECQGDVFFLQVCDPPTPLRHA